MYTHTIHAVSQLPVTIVIMTNLFSSVSCCCSTSSADILGHTRVELTPPGLFQWPKISQGLAKVWETGVTGRFMMKTTREAMQNTLVGLEIACWFFVGEMIGRRSIIGYKV